MSNHERVLCSVWDPHPTRLDHFLASMLPVSRTQLQAMIKAGCVSVNGTPVHTPRQALKRRERLEVSMPERVSLPDEPQDCVEWHAVYEDEHCLIVDKPAGLTVHPGAGQRDGTLMNALLHYDPSLGRLPRAGLVHRLDKDTSGLLMVAKHPEALQRLTEALQAREIHRHYWAMVHGTLRFGGEVNQPIGRHPKHRTRMAVNASGKTARTCYRVRSNLAGMTWLDITLDTGRTHQIRVHMSHMGHPLVGDALYRGTRVVAPHLSDADRAHIRACPRQALHARRLQFKHPMTGESLDLKADIPEDLANWWPLSPGGDADAEH